MVEVNYRFYTFVICILCSIASFSFIICSQNLPVDVSKGFVCLFFVLLHALRNGCCVVVWASYGVIHGVVVETVYFSFRV